jgi:hypothetical protein
MITAVGATKAVGDICGLLPLYSIIIANASDHSATIFDSRSEIKFAALNFIQRFNGSNVQASQFRLERLNHRAFESNLGRQSGTKNSS